MAGFRIFLRVLVLPHALFVAFTALVGAFADGGQLWQRLLVVVLHPVGAVAVLLLVFRSGLVVASIRPITAFLAAIGVADLLVARSIAAGAVRGDWELFAGFSVVPALGVAYAVALLRARRCTLA